MLHSLPLGLRVLRKVEVIVREEMDRAGAVELLMPAVQPAELWQETGRWDLFGPQMLKIKDRHDRDMLYGPTNEEMITEIFRAYVRSYKDLPLNLYHLQWKFRDEVRPRFGTMRSREFLMKDAYSFDLDYAGASHAYNRMFVAYLRTFARMGLRAIPMVADTGPIGGNLSHEFIILASTGESEVFCHRDYLDFTIPDADVNFGDVAALQAIVDKWTSLYAAPACSASVRASIFARAHSTSMPLALPAGESGSDTCQSVSPRRATTCSVPFPVRSATAMPGQTRLPLGARHLRLPLAPFKATILNLKQGDSATDAASENLYRELSARGVEVLYNDLEERPGAKFAAADLIGVPWHIMVGPRGLAEGKIELKCRADGSRALMTPADAVERLAR